MSLFAASLAGEIRAASAEATRLAAADLLPDALRAAIHRAEDCLADLERAERLLDSERASAEAARAALDRALQLAEIEAEQQRRADEAAQAAPAIDRKAEEQRLRKTLALAAEAIREAATLRNTPQPGEEIEDTRLRWDDAGRIEAAAKICSKAAGKALAALCVFPDRFTPEQVAERIEATRTAALALKAAIDAHRERAQRLRVGSSKKGGAK